jgi:hypothetical protein
LQWVIGIEPEVGDKLEYEQGQVSLDVRGHSRTVLDASSVEPVPDESGRGAIEDVGIERARRTGEASLDGELQWVIGIEPEVGDKLEYEQGQVSLDVRGHSLTVLDASSVEPVPDESGRGAIEDVGIERARRTGVAVGDWDRARSGRQARI